MPSKRNTVPGLLTHSTTLEHRKSSIISGCHDRCFFFKPGCCLGSGNPSSRGLKIALGFWDAECVSMHLRSMCMYDVYVCMYV